MKQVTHTPTPQNQSHAQKGRMTCLKKNSKKKSAKQN